MNSSCPVNYGSQRPREREDKNGEDLGERFFHDSTFAVPDLGDAVAAAAEPRGTSTALIVEDDHKSAKLVRLFLEAEGFSVVVASTGEEALDLASRVPFSLITLDVKLPGIDGWKFLLRLHDSPELSSIPVVVIAGDADMSVALSRGAAAVLEKPLKRAELQKSLSLLGLRPESSRTRSVTEEDPKNIDSDQGNPAAAMDRSDLNREALLAEIKRALE